MASGGRYVIDPETGEAKLVDRTEPAPAPWEIQPPEPAPPPPPEPSHAEEE